MRDRTGEGGRLAARRDREFDESRPVGGFWLPAAATAPVDRSFLGYEILTAEEQAVLKRLRRSPRRYSRHALLAGLRPKAALRRRRSMLDRLSIADLKRLAQLMLQLGL